MSSTSPRQGLSKTLRSFKARFIVGLTLTVLAAVFSASALTANLNGPEGQQAGSFAANIFSLFSAEKPKAEQPARVTSSSDDLTPLAMAPLTDLTKGGSDLTDAPAIAYSNPAPITINDAAPASPYPSNITVAGFPGSVSKVTVTVTGFGHTFPADVDMMLVGPSGQSAVLMSDLGGTTAVTARNYTFDDASLVAFPAGTAASGTYRPGNSGVGDAFPAPAPLSGSSPLTVFNGTNPNGVWSLYIVDDAGIDVGSITGGWSMEITPGACAAPPANMVAWYPGEVNTNDIIGDPPNNGAAQGPLGYTTGRVNNGFSMLGTSNVQVPPSASLNVGTAAGFTIDGWFNAANNTAPMPIVEWNDGTGAGVNNGVGVHVWANFPNPGDFYINAVDTAGNQHQAFALTGITGGTFNYFAWTINKSTGAVTLQFNGGTFAGTVTGAAPFTPLTSASMYLGRRPAGGNPAGSTGFFTGILDEVEIYNRVLTGAEVNSIFVANTTGKCHVSQIQFSQAAQLVGESSGSVLVTMKRIGANDTTANVEFATANGTAVAPGDYAALTIPTVTFAPGERTQTATVNINDDAIDEPDENFTANIANVTGAGASLGTPILQTITIQDNDAGAAFTVAPGATVVEGNTGTVNLVMTVNKTGATVFDETVNYTTAAPATATAGASCAAAGTDYITTTGTLTFLAAETSKTVSIPVCGDLAVEPDETFTLDLTTTSSGGTLTDGVGTILDDDSTVQFTLAGYSVAEGSAPPATTAANFIVSRSGMGTALPAAAVDASTLGAPPAPVATGGFLNCNDPASDYVIVSGTTINWAANDTANKNFTVQVCQNTVVEADENLAGDLSNPVNTVIGAQGTSVMTITNDDGAAIFNFNPNTTTAAVVEGTTQNYPVVRTFTVAGTTGSDVAGTVNFTITGSGTFQVTTAGAGQDIQASGSVSFPAGGSNTQNATFTSVDDSFFEPTETYTATLTSVTGNGTLGPNTTRSGALSDNDPRPVFRISENTTNCPAGPPAGTFGRCQVEGNGGTSAFIFDIAKISGDSQYPATVRVVTSDGGVATMTPATAPSDYTAISAVPNGGDPIVFAQGQTVGQFAVIVNGDNTFEDDEAFTVSINQVSIANDTPTLCASCIGSPAGRAAAILNEDAAPLFNLTATVGSPNETVTEGSGAGTTVARFTITKSGNPTELTSIVSGSTVNGSAVAPGDYTARINEALATFAPADTVKTFDVNIVRDTIREGTENFTVNLTNVTNGTFGPNTTGTGTINDDEPNPNFALSAVSASNPEGTAATFLVTMNFPSGLTGTEVSSTLSCASSVLSANSTIHAQSNDFSVASNSIVFAAGAANGSTQPCNFNTTQDTVFEGAETFNVALAGSSGAIGTISGTPQTATIVNNDNCSFVAGPRSQVEGNAGTSNFVHDVVKTCDSGTANAIVGYASSDGTAINPGDYTEIVPGNLNYTPATTSLPLVVSVNGDLLVEPDETYNVLLTGATINGVPVPNGACGVAVCAVTNGLGTILNDDGVPISISGTITNFPSGPAAGVTVVLSGSSSATTVTNASGGYTFTGLPSGGNFLVTPTAPAGFVASPTTRSYTGITASVANANFVLYAAGAIPRTLNVVNSYGAPGGTVTVPITLTAQGDEAALSFSLVYNSAILSNPAVACGSGSPLCALVANTGTPGVIGISVEAQDAGGLPTVWAAGTRITVNVTFNIGATAAANTPVTFADAPTLRRTSDPGSNPLPTVYNNGFVVLQQGIESDVAPRPSGDGTVLAADVIQTRRFVTNLDTPSTMTNEYQRVDAAPAATKGDGQLNASDVIQARRFAATLDPTQTAGGPFVAAPPPAPVAESRVFTKGKNGEIIESPASVGTILRVLNASGSPGQQIFVDIQLDHVAADRVVAVQTSVQFDNTKLAISNISTPGTNPDVTVGSGPAAGASLTVNATQASSGRIGFLVDSFPTLWAPGTGTQVVRLRFTIAQNAPAGLTPVTLVGTPVPQSISDDNAANVTFTNENGNVNIIVNPTAAGVTVAGRVTTPAGAGLRGATVSITDSEGNVRTVTTSTFGYYQFEDVEAGGNYVVAVASRRYRFAPRVLQVLDNLTDVDFQGQE